MYATLLIASALFGLSMALPKSAIDKTYKLVENDVEYNVFEHTATGSKLKYVSNSGICETTPGVNQHSGYLSVGTDQNMWFWFFEARKAATTAPLALWLNGGPGCSSMIGLFQEHGPCTFNSGGSKPVLNPYSWNNFANMLYVDQPIGAGFSYGDSAVSSTVEAAPAVWTLVQAFYAQFPEYESRDFGLFTESYGGHYGPEFAYYFEQQNSAIDAGTITGEKVNLVALGINNGWIDPVSQYEAYIEFAANNTYRPLISQSDAAQYLDAYDSQCKPAMAQCTGVTGNDDQCSQADDACRQAVEYPLESLATFDVYDIRASSDSYPPETYTRYLSSASVKKAIGATSNYVECGNVDIGSSDSARSFLDPLSSVIQSNINVLVWAGDADWICNWMGNFNAINSIGGTSFASAPIKSYTVGGKAYGEYKTSGNLNWLRVYGAGHEVPAYQPQAALAAFISIMSKQPLTSS